MFFSSLLFAACDGVERELSGADLRGGRGDVKAATAAETVKVVHECYSRVGQREAASHSVAQLGMMRFQSYWCKETAKGLYLSLFMCGHCLAVCAYTAKKSFFHDLIFFCLYVKTGRNGMR